MERLACRHTKASVITVVLCADSCICIHDVAVRLKAYQYAVCSSSDSESLLARLYAVAEWPKLINTLHALVAPLKAY